MVFSLSYPSIVKKQGSAPTITSSSLLWRDTDDNVLYFSDGTSWKQFSSSSDSSGYEQMVSQLALEILRLSAEGTLTAPDYDNMFVDYMADSDGQDDTLDLGNSDALFDTDNYVNGGLNSHDFVVSDTSAKTDKRGLKFTTTRAFNLTTVYKETGCTASECYLWDSSKNQLATASFVGDVATFNYSLSDATTYYLVVDSSGGSYTQKAGSTDVTYPVALDGFNFIGSYLASADNSGWWNNIRTIDVPSINRTLQTNAQSLGFTPAYVLVHVKDITLAGTGSVTYDISFDGGSTWDSTDNGLDEKISVVDGSSKSMVVKLNLNGEGVGNTSSIKDYEVVLWSS